MGELPGNPERQRGGVEFILHRAAEIYPSRLAIDDRLNGIKLTFSELRSRSVRLARGLESLGVTKGDIVATAFRNEAMAIEALFACCLIGAVSAPINGRLAQVEASEFIKSQRAVAFVAHESYGHFAEGSGVKSIILYTATPRSLPEGVANYTDLLDSRSDQLFPPRASWTDPYMIGMTGGTTGGSKGALWTHAGILFDVLSTINHWTIKNGYRSLCCAPLYHGAGLTWACLPVFWQAGTLIFPTTTSFDPAAFLRTVVEDKVDSFFLIPAMVPQLSKYWDGTPITSVKAIALASAPVPKAFRRKIAEMFPCAEKLVCYGMTECYSIAMQQPADFLEYGEGVGEPSLVTRVRIVDDEGREVGRGTAGHVLARTFSEALYYNNDDANTANTFQRCRDDPEELEWVRTGDVGCLAVDGRMTLLDRAKDVIISGGENVPSSEVESVLALHPDVVECAAIGLANEQWGELVCGVIVTSCRADEYRRIAEELYKMCLERLASFKIPKRFVFVLSLPRSAFGKVLKRELRTWQFADSIPTEEFRQSSRTKSRGRVKKCRAS